MSDKLKNALLSPDWADNPLYANSPTWADAATWHANNLRDALLAAQTPQFWTQAAQQYGNALLMGTTAPDAKFYRATNGDVARGADWMMYANHPDKVGHYGKNLYELDTSTINPKEIVDASSPKFQRKLVSALKGAPDLLEQYQATPQSLAAEAAPRNIVDSAGFWDAPDLAQHAWENVLEPNGWTLVRTPDGVVSFDPSHGRLISGK